MVVDDRAVVETDSDGGVSGEGDDSAVDPPNLFYHGFSTP